MDDEKMSSIMVDKLEKSDTPEDAATEIILATVTDVSEDGVSILIDGEDAAGEKEYRGNAAQLIEIGDRVKIRKNSGTYLIEYVIDAPMSRYPIPSGGTDGQVLTKDGANNYAVKWASIVFPHELPSGGSQGQVLLKSSGTDYAVEWATKGFLPTGGAKDQVLAKTSALNYEVNWVTPSHDLPTGGTNGQVLTKDGSTNYSVKWADTPHELPTGGTNGQYLVKNGATNYSVKWANAPTPTALTNGSYTVTCSNNGFLYPSAGNIALGANNYYFNGCYIKGAIRLGDSTYGNTLGFFGTTPQSKQTVSSTATLAQLIQALNKYGLV